ncbi:unnamed protein product [Brassica rapa subsp. trilocularis]
MASPPRGPRKRQAIQPGTPECRSQTEPMKNNRLHAPPPRAVGPSRTVARTMCCHWRNRKIEWNATSEEPTRLHQRPPVEIKGMDPRLAKSPIRTDTEALRTTAKSQILFNLFCLLMYS